MPKHMDILQKTLLLFILAVLCHGADYRAILRNHQNPDGLWRDDHGIDVQGTLFALTVLGSSSAYEDQAAAQRTRTAIYLNCQEDGSLLGTLPFALASQSDDIFMLSSFPSGLCRSILCRWCSVPAKRCETFLPIQGRRSHACLLRPPHPAEPPNAVKRSRRKYHSGVARIGYSVVKVLK